MTRVKGKALRLLAAVVFAASVGCASQDADYDGIPDSQDCDLSNGHADKSDMDIGCGCAVDDGRWHRAGRFQTCPCRAAGFLFSVLK